MTRRNKPGVIPGALLMLYSGTLQFYLSVPKITLNYNKYHYLFQFHPGEKESGLFYCCHFLISVYSFHLAQCGSVCFAPYSDSLSSTRQHEGRRPYLCTLTEYSRGIGEVRVTSGCELWSIAKKRSKKKTQVRDRTVQVMPVIITQQLSICS